MIRKALRIEQEFFNDPVAMEHYRKRQEALERFDQERARHKKMGIEEGKKEVARNMLKRDFPLDVVKRCSGLSEETLERDCINYVPEKKEPPQDKLTPEERKELVERAIKIHNELQKDPVSWKEFLRRKEIMDNEHNAIIEYNSAMSWSKSQGTEEGKAYVAQNMLKEGINTLLVEECSDLSMEYITKLRTSSSTSSDESKR